MCGTFWLTTKSAKFTKGFDFSDFFTFHFLCLNFLRDLRITIVKNLRGLRKFSSHCSYVAVLNEKIRPHHEVHEGHEGFRIFQTPNFVIFVSFVVNIFLPIWLRRSRARSFVVTKVFSDFLLQSLQGAENQLSPEFFFLLRGQLGIAGRTDDASGSDRA